MARRRSGDGGGGGGGDGGTDTVLGRKGHTLGYRVRAKKKPPPLPPVFNVAKFVMPREPNFESLGGAGEALKSCRGLLFRTFCPTAFSVLEVCIAFSWRGRPRPPCAVRSKRRGLFFARPGLKSCFCIHFMTKTNPRLEGLEARKSLHAAAAMVAAAEAATVGATAAARR